MKKRPISFLEYVVCLGLAALVVLWFYGPSDLLGLMRPKPSQPSPTYVVVPPPKPISPQGTKAKVPRLLFLSGGSLYVANKDGSIQPVISLVPSDSNHPTVFLTSVEPENDKYVVGGIFTIKNYVNLARLNGDLSLDTNFHCGFPAIDSSVTKAAVQSLAFSASGKLYIGSSWDGDAGYPQNLASEGDPAKELGYQGFAYDGTKSLTGVVRMDADGHYDSTFAAQYDPSVAPVTPPPQRLSSPYRALVNSLRELPDGKVLVGAGKALTFTDGTSNSTTNLARLNLDGSKDVTFNTGEGVVAKEEDAAVLSLLSRADGNYWVAGCFDSYKGVQTPLGLVCVTPTGDVATSVDTAIDDIKNSHDTRYIQDGKSYPSSVYHLTSLPNGDVLATGSFLVRGHPCGIVRVNPNGVLDPSWNPKGSGATMNETGAAFPTDLNGNAVGTNTPGVVDDAVVLPNGEIVIAGNFLQYNGMRRMGLALLRADGTLDESWDVQETKYANVLGSEIQRVIALPDNP